jgi:micrococcal nuclease
VKPLPIAALVVVPFVLFIAAGLVYQSQTGSDMVTGEKTGLAAKEVGQEQFEKIYKNEPVSSEEEFDSHRCIGDAKCVSQLITEIIDGDTIYTVNYKIRLSLVDTPEINEPGYAEATAFTAQMCPVGSFATIDQDDLQKYDQYDRLLANVYVCVGAIPEPEIVENNCDPSYPDFCIASYPPDLDCEDISQKRFTVLQPDPHRFDGDKNGIGCES